MSFTFSMYMHLVDNYIIILPIYSPRLYKDVYAVIAGGKHSRLASVCVCVCVVFPGVPWRDRWRRYSR